jgi:hypothetical protein
MNRQTRKQKKASASPEAGAVTGKGNAPRKNPYEKAIPYEKAKTDAYAVYANAETAWYVLKTYQPPEEAQDAAARALCLVINPIVDEELTDVYLSDIRGVRVGGADILGDGKETLNPDIKGIDMMTEIECLRRMSEVFAPDIPGWRKLFKTVRFGGEAG